jgi:probable rRNA maturation factor
VPVEIVRRNSGKRFSSRKVRKIASAVLRLVEQNQAELSLALVGNAEIQRLNAEYRKKDYPTDVLAFAGEDSPPGSVRLLGDVIISIEKAQEQASDRGIGLDEEMATLVIHGVLHLLGYDHERSPKDARIMKRREKEIFRGLCERRIIQV